jgi:hypothetical protein
MFRLLADDSWNRQPKRGDDDGSLLRCSQTMYEVAYFRLATSENYDEIGET